MQIGEPNICIRIQSSGFQLGKLRIEKNPLRHPGQIRSLGWILPQCVTLADWTLAVPTTMSTPILWLVKQACFHFSPVVCCLHHTKRLWKPAIILRPRGAAVQLQTGKWPRKGTGRGESPTWAMVHCHRKNPAVSRRLLRKRRNSWEIVFNSVLNSGLEISESAATGLIK